jgi:uncharacterized protein (DUF1919 family)
LIASNCNGCLILHDLGLRFNSPFVNMFIEAHDYIRLLSDLDEYLSKPLTFEANKDVTYPIAFLGDVKLHCVHYKSEAEVVEKWNSRIKRIDMSNCFVMFTERDGCDYELLEEFDRLPYKNKVVFTHKPYDNIKSAFYIRGYENDGCVGNMFHYQGWNGKKHYDKFDYVRWFNQENE